MTMKQKRMFSQLLMEYMSEMVDKAWENDKCPSDYDPNYTFGVKAQFNHALCIFKRISEDIKRGMT